MRFGAALTGANVRPAMGATVLAPRAQGLGRSGLVDRRSALRRPEPDQAAARRELRRQIGRLERDLGEAFVAAFPSGGLELPQGCGGHPRLLDLGELERARDELAVRLASARETIARRLREQQEKRELLARMLAAPAEHRFMRIACRELGEPGCGVWEVRPRLGLIGMLMGWWQVKLSSGCPLSGRPRGASS